MATPEQRIDNHWFAARMDTSDEWIVQRTGIAARRFVEDEDTSDLAIRAVEQLQLSDEELQNVRAILVATSTPNHVMPSTAALVHTAIGAPVACFSMDLNMACSGYVAGLKVMHGLLNEGDVGVLVGVDVLSKTLDMDDRTTCILFGDGAGASLVMKTDGKMSSVGGTKDGRKELQLKGLEAQPTVERPTLSMLGKEVYRFSMEVLPEAIGSVLEKRGWIASEVDWFILHQANGRILDGVAKKIGVLSERFPRNMQKYGNTSAASIALIMAEMQEDGRLERGQKLVLAGFGAGLTWQVVALEW